MFLKKKGINVGELGGERAYLFQVHVRPTLLMFTFGGTFSTCVLGTITRMSGIFKADFRRDTEYNKG